MFCSKCGRKVLDTMTFCPFCGTRLVLPDQEEVGAKSSMDESAPNVAEDVREENSSVWKFEPLDLDELEKEETAGPRPSERAGEKPRYAPYSPRTAQLHGHAPELHRDDPGTRRSDTYVPTRSVVTKDLFLDDEDEEEEEDYEFEERENDGFFARHIRGVVALALSAVVVFALAVWIFTPSGQQALAGVNLAWDADVYAQLANQYFRNSNCAAATEYYERALSRDGDNYDYAYSAGVCSYTGNDPEKAAEMAKLAVKIDPQRADAYELLQRIYPDAATRPWEVQSLLNARQQALREAQ